MEDVATVAREPAPAVGLRERARELEQRGGDGNRESAEGEAGSGLHDALEAAEWFHRVAE